jgi:diacylglycerol kinase (ATP)
MKVRVLLNPAAAAGRAARLLQPLRDAAGPGAEVLVPASAGETRALAAAAGAEGFERLVVVGGDGTVHQVLAGLAGGGPPLAIVPAGRGNDIAATLGLPRRLESALLLVREGHPCPFDLGLAGSQTFGGIACVGFDAMVTRRAAEAPPRLGGFLDYLRAVVSVTLRFEAPVIEATWEGRRLAGRHTLLALANVPRYGGGFRIAPGADPGDGLLNLVAVGPLSRLRILGLVPTALRGTHLHRSDVAHHRVRQVHLSSPAPLEIWADGEPLGTLPITVGIRPGAVTVLLPRRR